MTRQAKGASAPTESDRVDYVLDFLRTRDPEVDLSAKAVAMRLTRAGHWIEIQVGRRLAAVGIDLWELDILATMSRMKGSVPIGRLQDAAQVTAGAITSRVTRLERNGYVIRTTDPGDRRQVRVDLTDAGRRRAAEVIYASDQAQREALSQIDPGLLERLGTELRDFLLATEGPGRPDESTI